MQALGEDWNYVEVTNSHIRKFAAQLHSRGLSPSSISRKFSSWRGFFELLAEQTALASNPADGVKAPKRAKSLPKAVAADDVIHLVASGLRVSELAGISSDCGMSAATADITQM